MISLYERRQKPSSVVCSPTQLTTNYKLYSTDPPILLTGQPHKKHKKKTQFNQVSFEKTDEVLIQLIKKTKNLQDLLNVIAQQTDDNIKKACWDKMANAWEKYCFLINPDEYKSWIVRLNKHNITNMHDHTKIKSILLQSSNVTLTNSFRLFLQGIIHYTSPEKK